ncbi:MAG: acetyl-CoA hydrolase/transferase family protein [Bacteroidetes bacterium]|nr:acetyl-CoA hydrolase/transferase family protein [Bacteroidota bacterium]
MPKYKTASEALQIIKSGDKVFVQGSAATPQHLIKYLALRAGELRDVAITSISTLGEMPIANPEFKESFYFNSLFVSSNIRRAVNEGQGDYIPVFLSEIPRLFEKKILKIDVALVHVSPPDKHGYCSLGVSVDVTRSAIKNAGYVIAQVNPRMPRTLGDGLIHVDEINVMVEVDEALPEVFYKDKIRPCEIAIGKNCASLIEDGSTIQAGIGVIPDAVFQELHGHKDLGIHTEMFSDGVVDLVEKGIINNKFKKKHRRKIVATFALGSNKLYKMVDDNPQFAFLEADYVNDMSVIRNNPKVVAINSAIEMDLTGQVCAENIGPYQYSGVGGQMDFMRGAALSEDGKPIIAMASVTKNGESKIVPFLKHGSAVVTTRAHVHYVVTEYGIAYLYGKNLKDRAREMIKIAHPKYREWLEMEARKGILTGV